MVASPFANLNVLVAQTSEQEMLQKGQGIVGDATCSSEEVLYKIDIPANRYDMLCLEGIARALNIFRGRIPNVQYTLGLPSGWLCAHLLSLRCFLPGSAPLPKVPGPT